MLQPLAIVSLLLLLLTVFFQASYVYLYRREMENKSNDPHPNPLPEGEGTLEANPPQEREGTLSAERLPEKEPEEEPTLETAKSPLPPEVAVVLCLRGADPSLPDCLSGIVAQDYKNFELHVVFDNDTDPSQKIVAEFLDNRGDSVPTIHRYQLPGISEKGSLKCQAIVHVIESLHSDIDIVALIDADAIVDRRWLFDLIGPLADPEIAATTGNRWFTPPDDGLGSWVRQIWNAAAIVQMQLYRIPWGGSLAIKHSVIRETGLMEKWKTSFCEDTMLPSVIAKSNLKVFRVANVIVNNCESASLFSAFRWIARQLLTVRLYHRQWWLVLIHAIGVGLCAVIVPMVVVWSAWSGATESANILFSAWIGYQVCNGLLLRSISFPNLELLALKNEKVRSNDRRTIITFRYVVALIVAQLIQPVAAIVALFARKVRWREVDYKINRDGTVEVVQYRPFGEIQFRSGESIE